MTRAGAETEIHDPRYRFGKMLAVSAFFGCAPGSRK
jgi:hypothetical protein